MSEITSRNVQEALFNFLQRAFVGEGSASFQRNAEAEDWLFARFATLQPVNLNEMAQWPASCRETMRELLTQYVMFVTMFPDLAYPPDFLAGCTAMQLGPGVLAWCVEHQWPFPQMLQSQ